MNINDYLTEQSEILQDLLENFNNISSSEVSDKSDIIIATNMFLTEAKETEAMIRLGAQEKIASISRNPNLTPAVKTKRIAGIEATMNKRIANLKSSKKNVIQKAKDVITKQGKKVKKTGKEGTNAAKEFFNYVKKMKPGTKVAAVGIPLAAAGLYAANKYKKSNSPSPSNEEEHFDFSNLLNYDE